MVKISSFSSVTSALGSLTIVERRLKLFWECEVYFILLKGRKK